MDNSASAIKKRREESLMKSGGASVPSSSTLGTGAMDIKQRRMASRYGFDTLQESVARNLIRSSYGGWQDAGTLAQNRQTIQGVADRLQGYAKVNPKAQGLSDYYQQALGSWDDMTALYGQYQNGDAYNTAKEKQQLKAKYKGASYDDIQKALQTAKGTELEFLTRYTDYSSKEDFEKALERMQSRGLDQTTTGKKLKGAYESYKVDHSFDPYAQYLEDAQNSSLDISYNQFAPRAQLADQKANGSSYALMTDDEKMVAQYLDKKYGRDVATTYLQDMYGLVSKRDYQDKLAKEQAEIDEGGAWTNVAKTGKNLLTQAAALPFLVGEEVGGAIRGDYTPYGGVSGAYNLAQDSAGMISQEIADATQDSKLWNVGDTNIPSYMYGVLNSQANSNIGKIFGPAFTGLMGTGAYASTYKDAIEKGLDSESASKTALAAGLAESIFEIVSLGIWIKMDNPVTKKAILNNILKQFFVEGSEEVATDISNAFTDNLINGNMSDLALNYQHYLEMGYSESDANRLAAKDFGKQLAQSFVAGGLAGGGSAGVGSAVNYASNVNTGARVSDYDSMLQTMQDMDVEHGWGDGTGADSRSARFQALLDTYNGKFDTSNSKAELGLQVRQAYSEANPMEKLSITSAMKTKDEMAQDKAMAKAIKRDFKIGKKSDIKVAGVETTDDGTMLVIDENGEGHSAKEITLTQNDAYLAEVASEMPEDRRQAFLENYKGQDVDAYLDSFNLAYNLGMSQVGVSEAIKGINSQIMDGATASKLYLAGFEAKAMMHETDAKKSAEVLKEARKSFKAGKFTTKLNVRMLNAVERYYYRMGSFFSALGMNVEVIKDEVNDNGLFNIKGNTVTINLAARLTNDADSSRKYVLATMSHEFTHFIEHNDNAGFKVIQDALMRALGEQKWNKIVATEYALLDENLSENARYNTAISEAVARCCEDMLSDEKTMEEVLSKMNAKEITTFRQAIEKFFETMKKLFEHFGEAIKSDHDAAKMLREDMEAFEDVRKKWADAFAVALIRAQDVDVQAEDFMDALVSGDQETSQAIAEDVVGKVGDVGNLSSIKLDAKLSQDAKEYNDKHKLLKVDGSIAAGQSALNRAIALRADVARQLTALQKYLPADIEGDILVENGSYGRSSEHSLMCVRSLINEWFVDQVSEKAGRPLTVEEQLMCSAIISGIVGNDMECQYCYVASDRRAKREFLLTYYTAYKAVLKDVEANKEARRRELDFIRNNPEEFAKCCEEYNKAKKKRNAKAYEGKIDGFIDFLGKRKATENMAERYTRFLEDGLSGTQSLTLEDISTEERASELYEDAVKGWFVKDAYAYAQSASWGKIKSRKIKVNGKDMNLKYVAYNGSVLNLDNDLVKLLNDDFGLRMYSYSDYTPAFLLEDMQVVMDAAVRGLRMLSYTKDLGFVDVFALTRMGINVSCFGGIDGYGKSDSAYAQDTELKRLRAEYKSDYTNDAKRQAFLDRLSMYVHEDHMQGADWAKVQERRRIYENVGSVFVATNEDLVEWAMAQDWIDVVIPFHLVRAGGKTAKFFDFKDFKAQQEDKKKRGWNKKQEENPDLLKSIPPTVHKNDLATYLKALEDNHLRPRFSDFIKNPNYMKLVNETRLSYDKLGAVVPVFDEAAIDVELARIPVEGTYGLPKGINTYEELNDSFSEGIKTAVNNVANDGLLFSRRVGADEDQLNAGVNILKSGRTAGYQGYHLDGDGVVVLDSNLYSTKQIKSTFRSVRNAVEFYLQGMIGQQVTIAWDGRVLNFAQKDAHEYTWSASTNGGDPGYKRNKMNAARAFGAMIENARNPVYSKNLKPKHKIDAKRGWTYYEIVFGLPNNKDINYYKAKLSVRMDADGNDYGYDLVDIKFVESKRTTQIGTRKPTMRAVHIKNIPHNNYTVNTDSTGAVLSKEQIEFFKESRARDEEKQLIRFYHGTTKAGFTVFGPGYSFFTDNLDVAEGYSGVRNTYDPSVQMSFQDLADAFENVGEGSFEKINGKYVYESYDVAHTFNNLAEAQTYLFDHILSVAAQQDGTGPSNYEVYLNLVNPFVMDCNGENWDALSFEGATYNTREICDIAKKRGYDGVIFRNIVDNSMFNMTAPASTVGVAFNQSQIKAVGNQNPTSDPDIRYSKRIDSAVYEMVGESDSLVKENQKLKEDLARAYEMMKLQKTVTNGRMLKKSQIQAVARVISKYVKTTHGIDSAVDVNTLAEDIANLYQYIIDGDEYTAELGERVQAKAMEIADRIVGSTSKVYSGRDTQMKESLEYFRKLRVSFTKEQMQEAENTYGKDWRKQFFGSVIVSRDGGNLDSIWSELSDAYPDLFDAETNSGDMAVALLEGIDALKDASYIYATFSRQEVLRDIAGEIYDKYWSVDTMTTMADRHEKKIRQLQHEHRVAMTELKKAKNEKYEKQMLADRMYYGKLIQNIKNRNAREIQQIKDFQKQRSEAAKLQAQRSAMIGKITNLSNDMMRQLIKNDIKNAVPDVLKAPLNDLLSSIDYSSKSLLNRGEETRKDRSFATALRKMSEAVNRIDKIQNGEDIAGVDLITHFDLPPAYADTLQQLADNAEALKDKYDSQTMVLQAMSLDDLTELHNALTEMKHIIRNYNKIMSAGNNASISEVADRTNAYADRLGKAKDKNKLMQFADKFMKWDMSVPYYAFKHMGEGALEMFQYVADGWEQFARNIKEISDFAEKTYDEGVATKYEKDIHTFELLDLKAENPETAPKITVKMSMAHIMSLYCLNKREQARGHIYGGGIVVKGVVVDGKDYQQAKAVALTDTEVADILSVVENDPEAKRIADALQNYMNTKGSDWGNAITMKRFGIRGFTEENYFPIKSDANVLGTEVRDNEKSIYKLLNMSFTKALTTKANNQIEIDSIFNTFTGHMGDMAKYNALALPVLDMIKWWNYKYKIKGTGTQFTTVATRTNIENAFGKDANKYIQTFLQDLNGNAERGRGEYLVKIGVRRYKMAAVGFNLQVALLQPLSYIRAGYAMDRKYLIKAMAMKPAIQKAKDKSGIALWKSMGFYDTNISRGLDEMIRRDSNVLDKTLEASMKLAEYGDSFTWGVLWNACELEVKSTTGLTQGEAFDKAVANRFRDVILQTQVVDSSISRSTLMRAPDLITQTLTAFMSEPTIALNMLSDSVYQFGLDAREAGKHIAFANNGKKLARAIECYVIASAVESALRASIDALRDEEDEDEYLELLWKHFLDEMNLLNKVPVAKDIVSAIKGYSVERMDMGYIKSICQAWQGAQKAQDEGWSYKTTYKCLKAISQSTGLPVSNLMREIVTLWNISFGEMFDLEIDQ